MSKVLTNRSKVVLVSASFGLAVSGCWIHPVSDHDDIMSKIEYDQDTIALQNRGMLEADKYLPSTNEGITVATTDSAKWKLGGEGSVWRHEDCTGPALDIDVESTGGDDKYTYDKDGNPCVKADIIFDGNEPQFKRGPGTAVNIGFVDNFGPMPHQTTNTGEVIKVEIAPSKQAILPEDFSSKLNVEMGSPEPEQEVVGLNRANSNLAKTIYDWQDKQEREALIQESERLLADIRDIRRMSSKQLISAHQEKIEELMARLREAERVAERQQSRQQQVVQQVEQTRKSTEAERISWEQQQLEMAKQIDTLRQRLGEFKAVNRETKKQFDDKEKGYQEKIANLSGDLKDAERRADKTRQEMVLAAAQKIAEAEQIAFAARMARKQAMEAEAARLKAEGEEMLNRAGTLNSGRSVVISGMSDIMADGEFKAVDTPSVSNDGDVSADLAASMVTLHVEEMPLADVFERVMNSVEDQAGDWSVAWELRDDHQFLLNEKWTLAVEARFDELLASIQQRIEDEYDIKLRFQRFDRSHLFVIYD